MNNYIEEQENFKEYPKNNSVCLQVGDSENGVLSELCRESKMDLCDALLESLKYYYEETFGK